MNNTTKKNRMNNLKDYIESFSHLHTAKVKRRKAPHKAVLLLAIMDLVESKVIRNPRIELTDELVRKFNSVWKRYLGESSIFTPDITKPYFHMQYEPFWNLVEKHDFGALLVAEDKSWSIRVHLHSRIIISRLVVMRYSLSSILILVDRD